MGKSVRAKEQGGGQAGGSQVQSTAAGGVEAFRRQRPRRRRCANGESSTRRTPFDTAAGSHAQRISPVGQRREDDSKQYCIGLADGIALGPLGPLGPVVALGPMAP